MKNSSLLSESSHQKNNVYSDLRQQIIELKSEDIGLTRLSESEIIAVLMETNYSDVIATLVAVTDGTTSLYLSNGGGIIGSGGYKPVQQVSTEFIAMAQDYVSKGSKTETYPLPKKGNVRFYFITSSGLYTIEALEDDLGYERHEFSPLFLKGHDLIAAIQENTPE